MSSQAPELSLWLHSEDLGEGAWKAVSRHVCPALHTRLDSQHQAHSVSPMKSFHQVQAL